MSERRRIEGLTGTQVAASVMATMTGAIVASYLGVAGTIIGAAVASAATTAGTAVYRHYLGRTQQRLRTATSAIVPKVSAHTHHGHSAPLDPVRAEARRGPAQAETATAGAGPAQPGPAAASEGRSGAPDPAPTGADETQPVRTAQTDPVRAAAGLGETREIGRFGPGSTTSVPLGQPAPAGTPDAPTEPAQAGTPDPPTEPAQADHAGRGGWGGPRRWLVLAGAAVGVFLVTMAIITLVESATGKPLDAVVWQRHGSGTTVGDTVTGGSSRPHRSPSPSPARTAPATPGTSSPSPSPTQTSPAPVPSVTPSASPSPSAPTGASGSPVPAASSPAP